MRITESQLRRIVRQEILREQSEAQGSGSASLLDDKTRIEAMAKTLGFEGTDKSNAIKALTKREGENPTTVEALAATKLFREVLTSPDMFSKVSAVIKNIVAANKKEQASG